MTQNDVILFLYTFLIWFSYVEKPGSHTGKLLVFYVLISLDLYGIFCFVLIYINESR